MQLTNQIVTSLVLALILAYPCQSFGQNYSAQHYSLDDGLPQSQVSAIYQDPRGILWLGTYSGLSRFNGNQWQLFTISDGLARGHITHLGGDGKGLIYIGFSQMGMQVFDGKKFLTFPGFEGKTLGIVQTFFNDGPGKMWVGATKGLLYLDNGQIQRFTTDQGLPSNSCTTVYRTASGQLLVATPAGLTVFRDNQFLPLETGLGNNLINTVVEDFKGQLYLGTLKGLYVLPPGGGPAYPFQDQGKTLLHPINDGLRDAEGNLWFISNLNGLVGIRNGQFTTLNPANPQVKNPLSIHLDREQNLWIGTEYELIRYKPTPFTPYGVDSGLTHRFVRALHMDGQGTLWVGTRKGVTRIFADGTMENISHPLLSQAAIFDIDMKKDGTIVMATRQGLFLYKDGDVVHLDGDDGLPRNTLQMAFVDRDDTIWADCGGLVRIQGTAVERLPEGHPLRHREVVTALQDENGLLWLGTSHGLYTFDPASQDVRSFGEHFQDIVWSLDRDSSGRMWVATNGIGLLRFDGRRFKIFNTGNGLTDNFIWQVRVDSKGDVWAGHNKGLDRISEGHIEHFTTKDGLPGSEMSATAVVEDQQGRMWFGTGNGLVSYDPKKERSHTNAPAVVIEEVWVNHKQLTDWESPLQLPDSAHNIRIVYAAPFYSDEVYFSYQLEGAEHDYLPKTRETSVNFLGLTGGTYDFKVRAITDGGVWSHQEATLTFTVPPPYWARPWFIASASAAFLSILWLYGALRTYRVRQALTAAKNLLSQKRMALSLANAGLDECHDELSAYDELIRHVLGGANAAQAYSKLLHLGNRLFPNSRKGLLWLRHNQGTFYVGASFGFSMSGAKDLEMTSEEISECFFYPGETWGDGVYHTATICNLHLRDKLGKFGDSGSLLSISITLEERLESVLTLYGQKPFDPAQTRKLKRFAHHCRNVLTILHQDDQLQRQDLEITVQKEVLGRRESLLLHRQKQATLGTLTSGIASEFTNPSHFVNKNMHKMETTLSRVAQIVGERPGTIEAWQELSGLTQLLDTQLSTVGDGIEYIDQLSERLAGFCQTDPQESPKFDLLEALANVLIMMRDRFPYVSVCLQICDHLAYRVPKGTPEEMYRFPGEMAQVLLNLMLNACEAIEQRREQEGCQAPARLEVETVREDDTTRIRIRDTGIGIGEKERPHIFEPFFSTKEKTTGAGLGLYNVQRVLDRYCGQLEVESQRGQGSTFTLTLPI